MAKIIVEDLKHTYLDGSKKKTVLKGINAEFESGTFYSILGESGSGKTTFLSLLAGLDKVQSGKILFDGKDLNDIGLTTYRLNYVNVVFQSYNLIPYMTALENIMVAIDICKVKPENKSKKEFAFELLEKVGIDRETANRVVVRLSGGEQQRVAIARSLVQDAPFIMADEPSGNLDEDTEEKIINIFKELKKEGKGVIVVTHSKKVSQNADVILKIKNGVIS